jgi:hypothetical protein
MRFSNTLVNCVILNNSAAYGGGVKTRGGSIRICLIASNYCAQAGGGIDFWYQNDSRLVENCTICNNTANWGAGGLYWESGDGFVENSIIWANVANTTAYSNYYHDAGAGTYSFTNCYLAPDPGASVRTNCGFSDPLFVDLATGNAHLQSGSPCINAGINRTWMDGAKDQDGLSRIDRFSGRVDMGAYEYLPRGSLLIGR